jgi:hypothetical protein
MITLARASISDCLDYAGGRPFARKLMIGMHQGGEAYLIARDGTPLALAFLVPESDGFREFCLALHAGARENMRELCRAAQLILGRMAEDGPIISYVVPENRAGVRMARIVGFRPDPEHRYRWILGGRNDDIQGTFRRQRRREEAGGGRRGAAGGLE